jgi:hypothetical protein
VLRNVTMVLSIALRIIGVVLLVVAGSVWGWSVWVFVQAYSPARLDDSVNFEAIGGVCGAVAGTVLAAAGVLLYRRGVKR